MTRWARFMADGVPTFGTLDGNTLAEHSGDMFGTSTGTGRTFELDGAELLIPVVPGKVVALANNFHALLTKSGGTVPVEPLYFFKSNHCSNNP